MGNEFISPKEYQELQSNSSETLGIENLSSISEEGQTISIFFQKCFSKSTKYDIIQSQKSIREGNKMYDMHYDLLTILYYCCKSHEKFDYLSDYLEQLPKIYCDQNIVGGIINFYSDTVEEMKKFDIAEKELINIQETFSKSIKLFENMQILGLISDDFDFLYGLEGCDYLENFDILNELYKDGLRSVTPFYKLKNKYGSGYQGIGGITPDGSKLIEKIAELNMILDISHANDETFYDTLKIAKSIQENGTDLVVIASHSNVRELCNRPRNLSKNQLLKLQECGGYISLFTNGNFVSLNNEQLEHKQRVQNFLKHLDYIINEIGFETEKILIASDDMNFHPDQSYHNLEVFPLDQINTQVSKLITNHYGKEICDKITHRNAYQLFRKIK